MPHPVKLLRLDIPVSQTPGNRLPATDDVTRQRQIFAHVSGATAQEVSAAHIRKQADIGFGHGHLCALGHHAQIAALCDAHAAAHDDSVHEGHGGLGIRVNQVVKSVFLGKEIFQSRVASQGCLMKVADVTPCAKGTKRYRFTRGFVFNHASKSHR